MCALSLLLYKLNSSNCFKLFSSVLLSRSLIIPGWSPLASFDTGPHFFWNAVQKMKHSVLAETENSMQHRGKWNSYFISYKLYCSLHALVSCTSFFFNLFLRPFLQLLKKILFWHSSIQSREKVTELGPLCSKESWLLNRSQAEHKTQCYVVPIHISVHSTTVTTGNLEQQQTQRKTC